MQLLANNNRTALFTAIADGFTLSGHDCFKISSAYLVDFKAFRAAFTPQFSFGNDKVAVPASNLSGTVRYQSQNLVFAGIPIQ